MAGRAHYSLAYLPDNIRITETGCRKKLRKGIYFLWRETAGVDINFKTASRLCFFHTASLGTQPSYHPYGIRACGELREVRSFLLRPVCGGCERLESAFRQAVAILQQEREAGHRLPLLIQEKQGFGIDRQCHAPSRMVCYKNTVGRIVFCLYGPYKNRFRRRPPIERNAVHIDDSEKNAGQRERCYCRAGTKFAHKYYRGESTGHGEYDGVAREQIQSYTDIKNDVYEHGMEERDGDIHAPARVREKRPVVRP